MEGVRVYELAERLGIVPEDTLALARQQGERVRTTGGTISFETAPWMSEQHQRGALRIRIDASTREPLDRGRLHRQP